MNWLIYPAEVGLQDDLLKLQSDLGCQSNDQWFVVVGRQGIFKSAHKSVQMDNQFLNERILGFVTGEFILFGEWWTVNFSIINWLKDVQTSSISWLTDRKLSTHGLIRGLMADDLSWSWPKSDRERNLEAVPFKSAKHDCNLPLSRADKLLPKLAWTSLDKFFSSVSTHSILASMLFRVVCKTNSFSLTIVYTGVIWIFTRKLAFAFSVSEDWSRPCCKELWMTL